MAPEPVSAVEHSEMFEEKHHVQWTPLHSNLHGFRAAESFELKVLELCMAFRIVEMETFFRP